MAFPLLLHPSKHLHVHVQLFMGKYIGSKVMDIDCASLLGLCPFHFSQNPLFELPMLLLCSCVVKIYGKKRVKLG